MKRTKYLYPILASVFASTGLFADQKSEGYHAGKPQKAAYTTITPSAAPRVVNGADFFLNGQFLYWTSARAGLDLYTEAQGDNVTVPMPIEAIGYKWAPGFRVGVGLNLAHDGWDLSATYTNTRPYDTKTIEGIALNNVLFPVASKSSDALTGDLVGSWKLMFHAIDLNMGRNFFLSQYLTMRPFLGLKGTFQKEEVHFTTGKITDPIATTDKAYQSDLNTNTRGIGVATGSELSWYMGKSFSLCGHFGLTGMFAEYYDNSGRTDVYTTVKSDSSSKLTLDPNILVNLKRTGKLSSISPVIETSLGVKWDNWMDDDNYHFSLEAGWEQQQWLNWAVGPRLASAYDLSFHGLTVKARFDF